MPPPAAADFLEIVRKSGLVPAARLQPYLDQQAAGELPAESKGIAKQLIRDGALTAFQAEQCLAGKWRGFNLGKYTILDRIGAGGMGTVYAAEHSTMRRRVAIKVLPPSQSRDTESRERFLREARAAGALSHPNIVRAYDIDQAGDLFFLVMEYVDGASLHQLVATSGALDPVRAGQYLYQAALGLHSAHEAGLVHRDIKPANLLVDRQGTVKLLDLGLARFFGEDGSLTQQHDNKSVLGTADYLAPEQAMDSHAADARSDIYSLGATGYYLLTGRPPFGEGSVAEKILRHQMREPNPIRQYSPNVPDDLVAIIGQMMAKDPEARFPDAYTVAAALERYGRATVPPPADGELPARLGGAGPVSGAARSAMGRVPTGPASRSLPMPPAPSTQTYLAAETTRAPIPGHARPAWQRWLLIAGGLATLAGGALVAAWYWPEPTAAEKKPPTVAQTSAPKANVADASAKPKVVETPPKPKPKPKPNDSPFTGRELEVRTGGAYETVQAALDVAKAGDRIVLRDAIVTQTARATGKKLPANIRIEGRGPDGTPVVWRAPPDLPGDKPILEFANAEGFTLMNVTLDGEGKQNELLRCTGLMPGLLVQDVTMTRFTIFGARLLNLTATADRPARLVRVRTHGVRQTAAAGIRGGSDDPAKPFSHIEIEDCRLEGPIGAGVKVHGPVEKLRLTGNRFWKVDDGVHLLFQDKSPIGVTAEGNVFGQTRSGFAIQGNADTDGSRVVVRKSLLWECREPVRVEGVSLIPADSAVKSIWTDEVPEPLSNAPVGLRYFRSAFRWDGGEVKSAALDIIADDAYIAYVNGTEIKGRSNAWQDRRVFSHDVTAQLVPGDNVLAVRAENKPNSQPGGNGAFLLARLLVQPGSGPAVELTATGPLWKFSTDEPPTAWLRPGFDDTSWRPAYVPKQPTLSASLMPWDSLAQEKLGDLPRRLFAGSGDNARSKSITRYSYFLPSTSQETFTLPNDPTNDATFLRPPAGSAQAKRLGR